MTAKTKVNITLYMGEYTTKCNQLYFFKKIPIFEYTQLVSYVLKLGQNNISNAFYFNKM